MPAHTVRKIKMILTSKTGIYTIAAGASLLFFTAATIAAEMPIATSDSMRSNDLHYTPAGFFDIHVCNWPDRELFFMPLLSTIRYSEITGIEVQYPDGNTLTSLNLEKYMVLKQGDKPEKHVFMSQIEVPDSAQNGWYTATINLADGAKIIAKDYVIISHLPRASGMNPPDGADDIPTPEKLTWSSTGEGSYYQVFIRDSWNDDKLIYTSILLNKPELVIPSGLLQPGGSYSWKVHARDVNEDILLGDFNKGSMSRVATFSISEN